MMFLSRLVECAGLSLSSLSSHVEGTFSGGTFLDGFLKNPSLKIAMSGRAGKCGWASGVVRDLSFG